MKDHSKISYTAILCAKALSYNPNIPFAKEIYQKIKEKKLHNGSRIQLSLAGLGARLFSGIGLIMAFIEARYIGINKVLEKLGNPDVLELASGVTPRGIELSHKCNIIETDLKDLAKIKKEIISELNKNSFEIIPLNALDKKEFLAIGKKFSRKKPIAIVHSGLWTYLDKEEQIELTSNIKSFLQKYSPKGYWITPDIRPPSLLKNNFYRLYRKKITSRTGRPATRFNNEKELNEFMSKAGFKVKSVSILDEIYNNLEIPKLFHLKKEDVFKQAQGMKIYIMTLK